MKKVIVEVDKSKEIKSGKVDVGSIEDIQYFQNKIARGLDNGQTITSLEKTIKQLALLEDAVVIYNDHIPTFDETLKEQLLKNVSRVQEPIVSRVQEPIVSRVLNAIIDPYVDTLSIKEFVGIQPMYGPIGLSETLEYVKNEKNQLSLKLVKHPIEAGQCELETTWCLEVNHEVGDDELIKECAGKITKEIFTEVKSDLLKLANSLEISAKTNSQLHIGINLACNEIARKTRRGSGNFIIISENLSIMLNSNKTFKVNEEGIKDYGHVKLIGTLNSTVKVYVDEDAVDETVLVGYRGRNEEDAGYIYSPYMPVVSKGVVINPTTFDPLITFSTRYGKHVRTGEMNNSKNYYVNLTLTDLPDFKKL